MSDSNRLIHESSPYLLQHAHNPVDWHPWGDEALSKAKNENKLILVSIGYSACHWCHVMEHESFEDNEVAEIMNQHFVCIKVDREERPDIDQVYMSAVQLMTGRGGWPLNCFALPDGKPVYGGTYFPKNQWINILQNLADTFNKEPEKFADYAKQLVAGVEAIDSGSKKADGNWDDHIIHESVKTWKTKFDNIEGGPNRAPKFPLPNNYNFLLKYAILNNDSELLNHVNLTLKKMAYGGIYDQIGGGFARYAVDAIWKVPHFEKMLYDNAQLISLYSEAYRYSPDPVYKQIVEQTVEFVLRELQGSSGNFYAALDADSEGKEGKFYIWNKIELMDILREDFDLFAEYYNVNEKGFWEEGHYILLRDDDDEVIAAKNKISVNELNQKIQSISNKLLSIRAERIRPGLDDKTLTSWNALMVTGLLDAYNSFGTESYLTSARKCLTFILENQSDSGFKLLRNYKNEASSITGYLEDYAFLIEALIKMYQCTFNVDWLNKAKGLAEYVLIHFNDPDSELFYFTSDIDQPLFARQKEIQDNVIPASNSQMAINYFLLGIYFDKNEWVEKSRQMLITQKNEVGTYPSAYSNWLSLAMLHQYSTKEVVFCGSHALQMRSEFVSKPYPPGIIIAGCTDVENIPLTQHRLVPDSNLIYCCKNQACHLPVKTIDQALIQIND